MLRRALTLVAALTAAGGCGGEAPRPALVAVRVAQPAGPPERATGVVVGDGRVLTVAHVLERGGQVRVGDGVARVVRRDPALDLALLAAPGIDGPPVGAGVTDVAAGDAAEVLVARGGEVRARGAQVRRTVVARLVDQPGRPRRPSLELAVDVGPGDSGAPVVDRDGALVAVVYARSTRRYGTAYAVHGAGLRRLLGR